MRVIGADELARRLPMTAAIDALEHGFRTGDPSAIPMRTTVDTPAGSLLLMPASGDAGVGVKLVTLSPENPGRGVPFVNAVYVLFDAVTQRPEAVIDGAALTALRTAAVSGLATRFLANADARRLVIFGAGVQAAAHLTSMLAVRGLQHVTVVSRSEERARTLAATASASGVEGVVGSPDAVAEADVVCTCTTSTIPVVDGALLKPGVHVNAVGAYLPRTRELDTAAIVRAELVVETREAAFAEAGDILIPLEDHAIERSHVVADLRELVSGASVRSSTADITVFKSVGLAFEDLVVARAAVAAG